MDEWFNDCMKFYSEKSTKKSGKENEISTVILIKRNVIPLHVETHVICLGFWYIFGCTWIHFLIKNSFWVFGHTIDWFLLKCQFPQQPWCSVDRRHVTKLLLIIANICTELYSFQDAYAWSFHLSLTQNNLEFQMSFKFMLTLS